MPVFYPYQRGFQGPQGMPGSQGGSGTGGGHGHSGPQGDQGYQGRQGRTGQHGYQGPQGDQGYQGRQGRTGQYGPLGYQGNQGDQGRQGHTGNQGNQGHSGYQGVRGYQGSSGSPSDVRLKNNLADLDDSIDMINKLRVYSFDWNKNAPNKLAGRKGVGLIAQEVERIYDEAVIHGEEYLRINYGKFIPFLLKAVQELSVAYQELAATVNRGHQS